MAHLDESHRYALVVTILCEQAKAIKELTETLKQLRGSSQCQHTLEARELPGFVYCYGYPDKKLFQCSKCGWSTVARKYNFFAFISFSRANNTHKN